MTTNPHGVKVGQVWEDVDPRMHGRQFRVDAIEDTHAIVNVTRMNPNTYNNTGAKRIKLTRFKPTSTGYRLIKEN